MRARSLVMRRSECASRERVVFKAIALQRLWARSGAGVLCEEAERLPVARVACTSTIKVVARQVLAVGEGV
jgi:hypothetical protein